MPPKMRLDELLVERGYFTTTEAALRAVIAGKVRVDDVYPTSAGAKVPCDVDVYVKGVRQFVSRGGHKLQAALDTFAVDVDGKRCIDVGCSTGGFSDCLLQAGAGSLACVDVGYGELAWKIRNDERVSVFERTNIRTADPAELGAPFDVVVCDLSFIGLAQLAPTFASLCGPGSILLALVKPQFESAHDETQDGLVVDPDVRARTVEEVQEALEQVGFTVEGTMESPVPGKKAGNIEYFIHASF